MLFIIIAIIIILVITSAVAAVLRMIAFACIVALVIIFGSMYSTSSHAATTAETQQQDRITNDLLADQSNILLRRVEILQFMDRHPEYDGATLKYYTDMLKVLDKKFAIIAVKLQPYTLKLEAEQKQWVVDQTNKLRIQATFNSPEASDLRMRNANNNYDENLVKTEYIRTLGELNSAALNSKGLKLLSTNKELAMMLFTITSENKSVLGIVYSRIINPCNEESCLVEQGSVFEYFKNEVNNSVNTNEVLKAAYDQKKEAIRQLPFSKKMLIVLNASLVKTQLQLN